MKKVARMLRSKRALILNWFRAEGKISAGAVEGFITRLSSLSLLADKKEFEEMLEDKH